MSRAIIGTVYKYGVWFKSRHHSISQLLAMSTTSLIISVLVIFTSLAFLAQAETAKVGSLQWWKEELQAMEQKMDQHYTKLYKSNDFNFAYYSPKEDILVIGQNSLLDEVWLRTWFWRESIKDRQILKQAQKLSEYRQVGLKQWRLQYEWNVKIAMVRLLESQEHQKTYEKYLQQNKNYILLSGGWHKIDEDPKEQLFLKGIAETVKEEYLKLRPERKKQIEMTLLLTEMKDLKALLANKMEAYKKHLEDDYFSINDL